MDVTHEHASGYSVKFIIFPLLTSLFQFDAAVERQPGRIRVCESERNTQWKCS